MERLKHANLYFTTKDINTKTVRRVLVCYFPFCGGQGNHDVKLVQLRACSKVPFSTDVRPTNHYNCAPSQDGR